MEFLQDSADVHRCNQSRGSKYSRSPDPLALTCHRTKTCGYQSRGREYCLSSHPVMVLFLFHTPSDLWHILGVALFSVSRAPSFGQGTIIWHLTPGSEWLNGWFLAVSAVTSSVRGFVIYALPKIHLLARTAIRFPARGRQRDRE